MFHDSALLLCDRICTKNFYRGGINMWSFPLIIYYQVNEIIAQILQHTCMIYVINMCIHNLIKYKRGFTIRFYKSCNLPQKKAHDLLKKIYVVLHFYWCCMNTRGEEECIYLHQKFCVQLQSYLPFISKVGFNGMSKMHI